MFLQPCIGCGWLHLCSVGDGCGEWQNCLNVGVDVGCYCNVHLQRSTSFPGEVVIVSSLPDIPQGEENFCEESFQSGISYKTLKDALNTNLLLGKAISYDRWVE
jgi:hypothetical protein